MMVGYLTYIQIEHSGWFLNRIKRQQNTKHTPLSLAGGRHCPFSPLGPRTECLERVSSFGHGRLRDLQKASIIARDIKQKSPSNTINFHMQNSSMTIKVTKQNKKTFA